MKMGPTALLSSGLHMYLLPCAPAHVNTDLQMHEHPHTHSNNVDAVSM